MVCPDAESDGGGDGGVWVSSKCPRYWQWSKDTTVSSIRSGMVCPVAGSSDGRLGGWPADGSVPAAVWDHDTDHYKVWNGLF